MIQFILTKNKLNALLEASGFLPITISSGIIDQRRFIEEISRRTTLTTADILGVLESMTDVLLRSLLDGETVNTPMGSFRCSVKGKFDSKNSPFDRNRHSIVIHFRPNYLFKMKLSQGNAVLVEGRANAPVLDELWNQSNGSDPTVLTENSTLCLEGTRLVCDTTKEDEGIFFSNAATGETFRVTEYNSLRNSEVIFRIPSQLTAGEWKVELRRRAGSTLLKTGTLPGTLNFI